MAIVKKPKRYLTDTTKSDPMAFIQEADHRQVGTVVEFEHESARRKRKEPVIIRFDEDTLERVDRAAAKRGLSRAALVRMLVMENLPD
jgi:predicted DNA binding CopG/RHH family protein